MAATSTPTTSAKDEPWPDGWSIDLRFTQTAGQIGWQADVQRDGKRLCRLSATNCADDLPQARIHARRRILDWMAEWEARGHAS